jgi:hypothetical protein
MVTTATVILACSRARAANRGRCYCRGVDPKVLSSSSLLIAAAFYGLLLAIAGAAGLFGIWLGVLLTLSLWRYSYQVLRAVARGQREIAPPELETLNPVGEFRLVVHFVAFPLLVVALRTVMPFGDDPSGEALNAAAVLVVLALFPASAMAIALTASLEAAFDPRGVWRIIARLGRSYWTLVVALLGLLLATELVSAELLSTIAFGGVLRPMLGVWAVLTAFALIGTLLRANRHQFQIPGDHETDEERRSRLLREEWRRDLDLAYGSIRSGLVAEGYQTLRKLTARHADGAEVCYWLFENMVDWEDRRHALWLAEGMIGRHCEAGELYPALELFSRCRALEPGFAVAPEVTAALATFARSIGRHGLAEELGSVSP